MFPDGTERPVAYASRTLTSTEQNYSQLEKKAFSLIHGVQKFHQYLYGRQFVLITAHKPLTTTLGPKRGIPPLAAARLQRWAYTLSAYSYTVPLSSDPLNSMLMQMDFPDYLLELAMLLLWTVWKHLLLDRYKPCQ